MGVAKVSLPKKLYDDLVKWERQMGDMFGELDKAEACGVDCTSARDFIRQQLDAITSFKKHYGPQAS